MSKINIAIDGYSSCGKSTLAKQLAKDLGYVYVDSGAMYRAVTFYAMQHNLFSGMDLNHKRLIEELPNISITLTYDGLTEKQNTLLNQINIENEIRQMPVSQRVSQVAVVKEVRERMVYLQKQMALSKGVVMDGRDIGTVVMPNAELKIFMTASPEVRAQRRLAELEAKGVSVSYEEVIANLQHRDTIDTTREESPLVQAEDARVLDNSNISREEQLEMVKLWVKELI